MTKFKVIIKDQTYYFKWDRDYKPEKGTDDFIIISLIIEQLENSRSSRENAEALMNQIQAIELSDENND